MFVFPGTWANTWGWAINPLVPGWGTWLGYLAGVPGQRKNQIPKVFRFCLRLESGFLLFFGTGLISELRNPAAGENCLHFSILGRKTKSL